MPLIHIEQSALVEAQPDRIYQVLADYRVGHPAILPPKYFGNLTVERGGYGEGTAIRFRMFLWGQVTNLYAEITEPEPGRRLVETYPQTGIVTTFLVEPVDIRRTKVTFSTDWPAPGIQGWFLRLLMPRILKRIYREELGNLDRHVTGSAR